MNWSYLAGFIDGEGSIIIKPPRIRLYISNTNREILEKIKEFVKCGSIYEIKRRPNPKWSQQYGWTVCYHKDCLKILKSIRNKLMIKRQLCEEAIKYIKNKRWQGHYISKKELEKVNNLPSRAAAKKLGVSPFSILKYKKKYNLI